MSPLFESKSIEDTRLEQDNGPDIEDVDVSLKNKAAIFIKGITKKFKSNTETTTAVDSLYLVYNVDMSIV